MKRRFWQSQTENQNLHAEVKQLKDYISYLVKQNRHLNSLLASKNLSLTKMEENQKTLREQEKKQDQYLKDVSSKIEDLNAEISLYQKERSKVINENQNFRSTIEQLYKDKKQVSDLDFSCIIQLSLTHNISLIRGGAPMFEHKNSTLDNFISV